MDELEILKRDWKKKGDSFNQVSEKEIYGMLHKRSSSVVKWILIISILEIVFWVVLSFIFNDEEYNKTLKIYHLENILPILTYVNYVIIAYFIYLFYKNFKRINTTENVKNLMQSILQARKTVKHYVWYNLAMSFFSFMLVFIFQLKYDPNLEKAYEKAIDNIGPSLFYGILIIVYLLITLAIVGLIWVFYRVLYGILMKRLNNNYKELEKIDFN